MTVGKIQAAINALTPEQNQAISREIEELIRGDLSYIVNKYVRDYSWATQDTFGWTSDDLLQQIRIRLWRGLATFDPSRNVKKTTYLNDILSKYFSTISRRCKSKKNANSKLAPVGEIYDDFEKCEDENEIKGATSISESNESHEYFNTKLTEFQSEVFELFFIVGYEAWEVAEIMSVKPRKIASTVKQLRSKMSEHHREIEDELQEMTNDFHFELDPDCEPPICTE